ncbi:MAG: hypothetical protein Q4G42_04225 [Neisseria sp.]|nr:hypothetical protein [Neisseria sp.]
MGEGQDNNPFAFWQQFWQNATPQTAAFLPPLSIEETDKKIKEMKNVEVWLNFNLQAVRTQIGMLEQQKKFFESTRSAMDSMQPKDDTTPDETP